MMRTWMVRALWIASVVWGLGTNAIAAECSGRMDMEIDLSSHAPGEIARLWIPYPLSDAHQAVSAVAVSGTYSNMGFYADRTHGTPILYAEWPKDAPSRTLRLSFRVERKEIVRGALPTREPAWNPRDYEEYLRPTSLGPTDGEVKKLSNQITRGKKGVLAKARAIYDWAVDHMVRDPATVGCGQGDVCQLLQKPAGKCTDISSVFIALARAAGVPAREVFSVRLSKNPEENVTTWQHCWAEFFLPGYGWVSVDPADVAKKRLVEKLELKDPKTQQARDYFWGNIDPYRVVIAKGRDVVLEPPQQGAPLNTFGYPYAEVGGKPLDFYDPKGFSYSITFHRD